MLGSLRMAGFAFQFLVVNSQVKAGPSMIKVSGVNPGGSERICSGPVFDMAYRTFFNRRIPVNTAILHKPHTVLTGKTPGVRCAGKARMANVTSGFECGVLAAQRAWHQPGFIPDNKAQNSYGQERQGMI
jgi:hypothetical protein